MSKDKRTGFLKELKPNDLIEVEVDHGKTVTGRVLRITPTGYIITSHVRFRPNGEVQSSGVYIKAKILRKKEVKACE